MLLWHYFYLDVLDRVLDLLIDLILDVLVVSIAMIAIALVSLTLVILDSPMNFFGNTSRHLGPVVFALVGLLAFGVTRLSIADGAFSCLKIPSPSGSTLSMTGT